ncbi:MAG: DUF4442 domain-containing protein [Myxococcota bacterium]|nr:DUF4442 domain-containing protein [Myxococcota bacterium]MEC8378872.1 DUF4442 domain-containing protein [Myxococcota bacterium]
MSWLSDTAKVNWLLWGFGLAKIPMLYMCRPKVLALDDDHCEVKIPLNRRTKNHENCMYIAALTVGADIAGGLIAIHHMKDDRKNARFLFKSMTAVYLKRAEGDVHFRCLDGQALAELVRRARASGERITVPVTVVATVPDKFGNEPVARFELEFSAKIRQASAAK